MGRWGGFDNDNDDDDDDDDDFNDNNDNSRFSFGCMLYKLLKGHSPFRQHKTKVNQASINSLFSRHTHKTNTNTQIQLHIGKHDKHN